MIDIENILIGMPQIINITSLLSIIVTGNIDLSYFLIYNLIFGNGLNALIKYILQRTQILPKKIGERRPCGRGKATRYRP